MIDCPETWTPVPLGELADFEMGQAPPGLECNRDGVGTPFVKAGEFGAERPIIREWTTKPLKFAKETDVLICVVGATAGKLNLGADCAIGRSAAAIRPSEAIDQLYLHRFLKTRVNDLRAGSTGSAQGVISKTALAQEPVPLAPLPEQLRIVAKLDRLSARSAAARDHLARTTKLATRAKQAVLSAAFRGELLGLDPIDTPKFNGRCWDLPDGWRWTHFEDVATIRSNLNPPSEMPELPHVAPDNIEAGTGRLLPYNTIAEDGVKSGKHKFFAGQIIYSKIRPYLRKAVIVNFDGACSADMYPVECGPELDVHFLHRWLISEDFAWFTAEHEGRSVLPKINQKALNASPVPVPPTDHQAKLVRHIEAAFARIDRMTEEASRAAHLLDRLDQRLLAKAFRGELVPQNPEDEPAEALLTRIHEARAAAPKAKRGRKAKY